MIKKTKQVVEKYAREALDFVKQNDRKTVLKHVLSHDAHPLLQFTKYVICGVAAVTIHLTVVYVLGFTILPAIGTDIPIELKQHNGMINNVIAFFVSGAVVYWLNRTFVFKPGRHHAFLEVFLFFTVSAIPLAAASGVNWMIYHYSEVLREVNLFEYVEHFANFGFIVTSAMVNFLARKFIIFKG